MTKKLLAVAFLVTLATLAWGHQQDAPLINPTFQSVKVDSTGNVHVQIGAGTGDSLDLYFVGDSVASNCGRLFWDAGFLKYLKCNSNDTIVIDNPSAGQDDTTKWIINDDTTASFHIDNDSAIYATDNAHIIFKSPDVLTIQADTVGKTNVNGFVTILGQLRLMIDSATTGDVRQLLPFDSVEAGGPSVGDVYAWDGSQFEIQAQAGGGGLDSAEIMQVVRDSGVTTFSDTALFLVENRGSDTLLRINDDTLMFVVGGAIDDTLLTFARSNGNLVTWPGQDGNQTWSIYPDTIHDGNGNVISFFADGGVATGLDVVANRLRIDASMAGAGLTGGDGVAFAVGSDSTIGVSANAIGVFAIPDGAVSGKGKIDSTSANFVFDEAYKVTSAEADSAYATEAMVNLVSDTANRARDSVNAWDNGARFVEQDGSTPMTANWAFGGFDLSGVEKLNTVDTIGFGASDPVLALAGDSINDFTGTDLEMSTSAPGALQLASSVSDAADSIPVWDNGVLWWSDGSATASGTWDLGALTGLEIPNAANPSLTTGQIAHNTTDELLEGDDGTNEFAWAGEDKLFSRTISDPDQLAHDTVMILPIETEWAPHGITITSLGIKTWAATTYSVTFMFYTEPGNGGTETTIRTVATSASREQKETSGFTDADGAAGDIIMLELPATDIEQLMAFGTFIINDD